MTQAKACGYFPQDVILSAAKNLASISATQRIENWIPKRALGSYKLKYKANYSSLYIKSFSE